MRPFTAILVDDEPLALEGLRRICVRDGRVNIVGIAADGQAALDLVAEKAPEAVFLDIGMPGLTGMDIAARLNDLKRRPSIVFVTAYDHYAAEAFDLAVTDYVLKPIDAARLGRAIDRVAATIASSPRGRDPDMEADSFWAPHRGSLVRVPLAAIQSVEAEGDYVRLHTPSGSHLLRQSMGIISERLPQVLFVRVHRSSIVRRDRIIELRHLGGGAWAAIDRDGRSVRIGRSYLGGVRDILGLHPLAKG